MYAVVETGSKQYRVRIGDKLKVEKLDVEEGASLQFDKVLMVNDDGKVTVGAPHVEGTAVKATVLAQGRGEKIRVVKFKRRKKYRRLQGHRQSFTELEITAIGDTKAPAKEAAAKKAPAKKAVAKEAVAKEAVAKEAVAKEAVAKEAVAKEAVAKKAVAKKEVAKKAPAKKAAPKKAVAKATGDGDKLSTIKGISAVLEGKLNDIGITTFTQIAALTPEQVEELSGKLKCKGRIEREQWVEQAKELA